MVTKMRNRGLATEEVLGHFSSGAYRTLCQQGYVRLDVIRHLEILEEAREVPQSRFKLVFYRYLSSFLGQVLRDERLVMPPTWLGVLVYCTDLISSIFHLPSCDFVFFLHPFAINENCGGKMPIK